VRAQGAMTH